MVRKKQEEALDVLCPQAGAEAKSAQSVEIPDHDDFSDYVEPDPEDPRTIKVDQEPGPIAPGEGPPRSVTAIKQAVTRLDVGEGQAPAQPPGIDIPPNPMEKQLDVDPVREELLKYFVGDEIFGDVYMLALGRGVPIGTLLDQGLQLAFDIGAFDSAEAQKEEGSARRALDDVPHYFENIRLRSLVTAMHYEAVLAAARAAGVDNKNGFKFGLKAALQRGGI